MTFESAKDRVEYRLTFDKCEPRDFGQDSLSGPEGTIAQPGECYGGNMLEADAPDEEWLSFFAGMCIAEAVHEALEWFKVDGRPWLNPHGENEKALHHHAGQLVARLS